MKAHPWDVSSACKATGCEDQRIMPGLRRLPVDLPVAQLQGQTCWVIMRNGSPTAPVSRPCWNQRHDLRSDLPCWRLHYITNRKEGQAPGLTHLEWVSHGNMAGQRPGHNPVDVLVRRTPTYKADAGVLRRAPSPHQWQIHPIPFAEGHRVAIHAAAQQPTQPRDRLARRCELRGA